MEHTTTNDAEHRFIKAAERVQPRFNAETSRDSQLSSSFAPRRIKEPIVANSDTSIAESASIMQSTENTTTAMSSYAQSQVRRQATSLILGAVAFASLAIIAFLR